MFFMPMCKTFGISLVQSQQFWDLHIEFKAVKTVTPPALLPSVETRVERKPHESFSIWTHDWPSILKRETERPDQIRRSCAGLCVWPFVGDGRRGRWHGGTRPLGHRGQRGRRLRLRGRRVLSLVLRRAVQRQVDHLHFLAAAAVAGGRGAQLIGACGRPTRTCGWILRLQSKKHICELICTHTNVFTMGVFVTMATST